MYGLSRLAHGDTNFFAGPRSPSGQKLLFTSIGLIHGYVGVMNADGSGQAPLTRQSGSDEEFFTWLPDGDRLVIRRDHEGVSDVYYGPC